MRKLDIFILSAAFALGSAFSFSEKTTVSANEIEKMVYVGGMSAGFTLKTGGAQIIGLSEILTENGTLSPAAKAGIRVGDVIYAVNKIFKTVFFSSFLKICYCFGQSFATCEFAGV